MFTEPVNQELIRAIRDQNDTYVEVNLVRRMTLGLTHLINEISSSSAFAGKVATNNSHSDSTGRFIMGTSNPILSKRYKLQELIGEGTFSQIYKATDSYFCCDVAIKVMRIGFHVLGMREVAFLRYFNSKQLRGAQQFVRLLGSFRFEKHFCIVLELYDNTLLSLLTMPEFNPAMHSESTNLPGIQNLLHQPKVVRPSITKNGFSNSPINNNNQKSGGRERLEKVTIDLKKLRKIAESLIFALCILHKEGAIHADIKPENCFIREQESKPPLASETNDSINSNNNNGSSSSPFTSLKSKIIKKSMNNLSESFELRLGDFGNSIHISEVCKYYEEFDIQTLSYRAPEVLLGIPFGYQIDVWSLGIVLMELIIGKPLFIVKTRTELYEAICMNISIPSRIRFAGGLYSELLDIDIEGGNNDIKIKNENFGNFEINNNFSKISSNLNSKINFSQHLLNINKILVKSIQSHIPNELVHFLAGLLHPDPDFRLTPTDALNHPFISNGSSYPSCMLGGVMSRPSRIGAATVGLNILRSNSQQCETVRKKQKI